ncbi:MAG: threonine-phosphate decarboxylase CobD [Caulobacteraceae bacterium]
MSPLAGHGGRLAAARRAFPGAPTPWLDLSTGVNPRPYPAPHASRTARARLPDPDETRALEVAAAHAFGCGPERVLATPGAEAAIRLLASAIDMGSVAIAGPTYSGHEAAWREAGVPTSLIRRSDAGAATAEAIVLVNPNNPDGAAMPASEAAAILAARRGWLIMDESFVETAPALSVAGIEAARLVVLRSFGKFYGLAGLRLGFVIGEPALIERLRARQGEWPVSADAIAAGLAAYADAAWMERARARLARDQIRLDRLLAAAGLEVQGGTSLFRLVRAPDARRRFERLAQQGVLVRPFAYAADWLRFGLPPATAWGRLEAALMESAR